MTNSPRSGWANTCPHANTCMRAHAHMHTSIWVDLFVSGASDENRMEPNVGRRRERRWWRSAAVAAAERSCRWRWRRRWRAGLEVLEEEQQQQAEEDGECWQGLWSSANFFVKIIECQNHLLYFFLTILAWPKSSVCIYWPCVYLLTIYLTDNNLMNYFHLRTMQIINAQHYQYFLHFLNMYLSWGLCFNFHNNMLQIDLCCPLSSHLSEFSLWISNEFRSSLSR